MNVAEWIIVGILAFFLLVFLLVGIFAMLAFKSLAEEAKKVVEKGQDIADTANDIAENVKGMTSFGKVIHTLADTVEDSIENHEKSKKKSEKSEKSKKS